MSVRLGAVFRTVLLSLRTLLIWIANLCLFYASPGAGLGEHWDNLASPVQLGGFAVLLLGTLLYSQGCSSVARDTTTVVKDIEEMYAALADPEVQAQEQAAESPTCQMALLSPDLLTSAAARSSLDSGQLPPISPTRSLTLHPGRLSDGSQPITFASLDDAQHHASQLSQLAQQGQLGSSISGGPTSARTTHGSFFGRALPGVITGAATTPKAALARKFERELQSVAGSGVFDVMATTPHSPQVAHSLMGATEAVHPLGSSWPPPSEHALTSRSLGAGAPLFWACRSLSDQDSIPATQSVARASR